MKMCEEMKKLRAELDKRGIPWEDRSTITPEEEIQKWVMLGYNKRIANRTIYRTRFTVGESEYSVINGCYTYGGYTPLGEENLGLLECMASDKDDVIGYMTAEDVISLFEKKGNKK